MNNAWHHGASVMREQRVLRHIRADATSRSGKTIRCAAHCALMARQARLFRDEIVPALAKQDIELLRWIDLTRDEQKQEVGEFLQAIEDHDDVHRIWAALK